MSQRDGKIIQAKVKAYEEVSKKNKMLNLVRTESKANDSDQFLKREISSSPTLLSPPESATVQEVIGNSEETLTESVEAVPSLNL